jgi:hypothetical protein
MGALPCGWDHVEAGGKTGAIVGTAILISGFIFHFSESALFSFIINALIYIIVSLLPLKPSEHIERMFFDEVEEFIEETA